MTTQPVSSPGHPEARKAVPRPTVFDVVGYRLSIVGLYVCALSLSLVVFAALLLGESMTSQFDSGASLFTYFGITVVLMLFVLMLPPYRSARWLSSLRPD